MLEEELEKSRIQENESKLTGYRGRRIIAVIKNLTIDFCFQSFCLVWPGTLALQAMP